MSNSNIGDVNYTYPLPTSGLNIRIRNTLSQFSDIFSEFNKYIAPAYHHDRCERFCTLFTVCNFIFASITLQISANEIVHYAQKGICDGHDWILLLLWFGVFHRLSR